MIKKKIQTRLKVILKFFFLKEEEGEEEEETLAHVYAHDEQNMQPICFKLYTKILRGIPINQWIFDNV